MNLPSVSVKKSLTVKKCYNESLVSAFTYKIVKLFILHYFRLQLDISGMFLTNLLPRIELARLVLVPHQLHFAKATLAQRRLRAEVGGVEAGTGVSAPAY